MSAVSWRAWRLAFIVAIGAVSAARAETINVAIDEAHIMHLPQGASTIVIGNPLIADASLQSGGILVITGKGFGSTNLIALDHHGQVILDRDVEVKRRAAPISSWSTEGTSASHIAARRNARRASRSVMTTEHRRRARAECAAAGAAGVK